MSNFQLPPFTVQIEEGATENDPPHITVPWYQWFMLLVAVINEVVNGTAITSHVLEHEIPTGTVNGVNDTFTLAQTPNPTTSLDLRKNGVGMAGQHQNPSIYDYVLTGATVVFIAEAIPQTGDRLDYSLRY